MVDNIDDCYLTLMNIHSLYKPVNDKFKDYICNPKTNMYRSLHTTVFGADDRLVQNQIRTFDMDKIASFGLTSYWDINGNKARNVMQEELKTKYQFFNSLIEINRVFGDNQDFVNQIKTELFTDKVYVYSTKGEIFEFPKGSTIIDFAYRIHTDIGDNMIGAYVNDKYEDVYYTLQNKDRIRIITNNFSSGPKKEWENYAHTTKAKCKIKEFHKKFHN